MEYLALALFFLSGWLLIAYSRELAAFVTLIFYRPPLPPTPPPPPPPPPPLTGEAAEEKIAELLRKNRRRDS